MGVFNWTKNFLVKTKNGDGYELREACFELAVEYYFKKLAIETCIDLIANTITRCEFQTFQKGKRFRGENYYLFNVEPNQNQNASEFLHSLVSRLFKRNECLVIMQNNMLYVADEFTRNEKAIKNNYYTDVVVKGWKFDKNFEEKEVLYFKLNDTDIMKVIDGMYNSYGKLLTSAQNFYKRSNAKRFLGKGKALKSTKDQKVLDEMLSLRFKTWLDPDKDGNVLHLGDDASLEDFSNSSASSSRDIRAIVDDIFDYTAMAFHIPRGLLKGDLAEVDKQTDNFLMFCILPLVELIKDEINRKVYKKKDFLERTYLKIDTERIKIVDIVALANALDKLFAIGINSINDGIEWFGREPIDEEWANERYVTKNYQSVENITQGEGGDLVNANSENRKKV